MRCYVVETLYTKVGRVYTRLDGTLYSLTVLNSRSSLANDYRQAPYLLYGPSRGLRNTLLVLLVELV